MGAAGGAGVAEAAGLAAGVDDAAGTEAAGADPAGAPDSAAGAGRFVVVTAGASVCAGMTEDPPIPFFPIKAREKDVSINIMAAPVVSLPRKLPGPLLPNIVWLDAVPKDAPISAPLPD